MATRDRTSVPTLNTRSTVMLWSGLLQGDNGEAMPFSQYTDKSVQVSGVFGGATLAFEGSNDGTNYHTLTDPQGNALEFTAAGLEQATEATAYVRPRVVGGGGTTNLAVHLFCKE